MKEIQFKVNGEEVSIKSPPASTLLDVLRDELDLIGAKECCGKGECGSCSVEIDGEVVCSCLMFIGQAERTSITTVEGIGQVGSMDVMQQAFVDEGATQCGYCTPGIIVSAKAFINSIDHIPTDDEVKTALGGNLCRCTGYTKIIKAVQTAARRQLAAGGAPG